MFNGFRILTFTHKKCNLRDISRFMVRCREDETLEGKLSEIKSRYGFSEFMYVSTCNRVMYIMYVESPQLEFKISEFLEVLNDETSSQDEISGIDMSEYYEGQAAVHHLVSVASSLDSMVVGEREILRQLRNSYEQSRVWGLAGDNLRLLMKLCVQSAKDVFTNTKIGDKPVSVVSLVIQQLLAKNPARDAGILMIGAGQTNLLVSKFLLKLGYWNVTVFNRSASKAKLIADKFKRVALSLDDLSAHTAEFDVIIICTGSQEPILTGTVFQNLIRNNTHKKLIIDLSVPANVSEEVRHKTTVDYVDVEMLKEISQHNLNFRRAEVTKAGIILEKHIHAFRQVFHQRLIERAMSDVPRDIKAIRNKAVNEVFRKDLDSLDPRSREILDNILNYMEKKSISIPIKAVKEIMLPGIFEKKSVSV